MDRCVPERLELKGEEIGACLTDGVGGEGEEESQVEGMGVKEVGWEDCGGSVAFV
jgi:hypothetical protein